MATVFRRVQGFGSVPRSGGTFGGRGLRCLIMKPSSERDVGYLPVPPFLTHYLGVTFPRERRAEHSLAISMSRPCSGLLLAYLLPHQPERKEVRCSDFLGAPLLPHRLSACGGGTPGPQPVFEGLSFPRNGEA